MRGLNMNNEVVKTLLYTSEDGAVAINVIQKMTPCGLHKKPWQNYLVKISRP